MVVVTSFICDKSPIKDPVDLDHQQRRAESGEFVECRWELDPDNYGEGYKGVDLNFSIAREGNRYHVRMDNGGDLSAIPHKKPIAGVE